MIKLKDLINERIDFSDTETQIVKSYKLKSKIKFGVGKNKGEYEWKSDTINLRPSYSSIKEFLYNILAKSLLLFTIILFFSTVTIVSMIV